MKSQSQRDLEKHWAEQSKRLTPAERLRIKAEKLHKRIERDKALLERRKQGEGSAVQLAGQTPPAAKAENGGKASKSKSESGRRAKE